MLMNDDAILIFGLVGLLAVYVVALAGMVVW